MSFFSAQEAFNEMLLLLTNVDWNVHEPLNWNALDRAVTIFDDILRLCEPVFCAIIFDSVIKLITYYFLFLQNKKGVKFVRAIKNTLHYLLTTRKRVFF